MDEFIALFQSDEFAYHVVAFAIGIARLFSFVSFAPFFGPQVTTVVTYPIAIALYLPLHQVVYNSVKVMGITTFPEITDILLLVGKEIFIGFVLAYVCSCIFYVALSAGTIIDNQRGASMAQGQDILSGAETSPLGDALVLSMITLFMVSGAFLNFLELFYSTYVAWPPASFLPSLLSQNIYEFSIEQINFMMTQALLVCAPFVVVALMCDLSLGLVNRFAPQLNVFILSMPIKSGVCALLIIFYINPFLRHAQYLFGILKGNIIDMLRILGS